MIWYILVFITKVNFGTFRRVSSVTWPAMLLLQLAKITQNFLFVIKTFKFKHTLRVLLLWFVGCGDRTLAALVALPVAGVWLLTVVSTLLLLRLLLLRLLLLRLLFRLLFRLLLFGLAVFVFGAFFLFLTFRLVKARYTLLFGQVECLRFFGFLNLFFGQQVVHFFSLAVKLYDFEGALGGYGDEIGRDSLVGGVGEGSGQNILLEQEVVGVECL